VFTCACATTEAGEPEPVSPVHHAINYIEITVTDMQLAKRFYSSAFGWEFNDYGPEYAGIRKQVGEAGGLRLDTQVSAGVGTPLVILYSRDLALTVSNVLAAGGRVLREPFEFPGSSRFHFQDPSGNELAAWSDK
jgi:predicted enzyme related to lactoylglutathione lyase